MLAAGITTEKAARVTVCTDMFATTARRRLPAMNRLSMSRSIVEAALLVARRVNGGGDLLAAAELAEDCNAASPAGEAESSAGNGVGRRDRHRDD
jgi:hypothetical protein